VSGPFITARGMAGSQMNELVTIGEANVIGEIIRLEGDTAAIQAYEETAGIKPGEKVTGTGKPLSVELGPGLIGQIYDGIQRPLPIVQELAGPKIRRGIIPPALSRNKKWHFHPTVKKGAEVLRGDIIGWVDETQIVKHKILVPPWIKKATVEDIATESEFTVTDPIAEIRNTDGSENLYLMHTWHVRQARPYDAMLQPSVPLLTGQRIIDAFFPLAKGGMATIPGGFGTGKTVMLQTLAQWADADLVILVGCGERGNEMADVIEKFPKLKDHRSGQSLMSRTIIVANTSDMPIAAREASIYTAASLAEYYRDMGYDVALMADSTSRWAEALREISGRLEEMPGEEGYPAYLSSRLAEFYARAGRVKTLGSDERYGSVTAIGSVSPPGGDFSEPVTGGTLRISKVFWALDFALAHRRHFPAINWFMSYSEYILPLESWYENVGHDWIRLREEAMSLLKEEEELREIASLVGAEILGDKQRCVFEAAKMLKEYFLLQSAIHPVDMNCPIKKTYHLLRLILKFYEKSKLAVESGVPLSQVLSLDVKEDLARMKITQTEEFDEARTRVDRKLTEQFDHLTQEFAEGKTV